MATAEQFSMELGQWGEKVAKKDSVNFLKKISLEVYNRVTEKSPVDTGRFKGNWMVGIGKSSEETLGVHTPGDAKAENLRQEAVIYSISKLAMVHVSNNLDYALKLENGSSKQAPAGMVGITVQEVETHFKNVKEV